MRIIYAIDGGGIITAKMLKEAGLGHIGPCEKLQQIETVSGPGGRKAVLFWHGGPVEMLRYQPDKQVWIESLNGKYRLGFYTDYRPTPEELKRDAVIDGHDVLLGDEKRYTIPVARCFPTGTKLPRTLRITKTGEITSSVIGKYIDFSTRCERLWNVFAFENKIQPEDPGYHISQKEQWDLTVDALCLNYYISADEVNLLGLMTSDTFITALVATIDVPTLEKLAKNYEDDKKKQHITET